MFQLKNYQKNTLDKIKEYVKQIKFQGVEIPFEQISKTKYNPIKGLEDVPYICLRLPTGGGKTYLSASSIPIISKEYLEIESPIILWYCPTDIIRKQALESLKNPRHPNRIILEESFGSDIVVFDIADFANIKIQDINKKCCIFVATFSSTNINNTEGRKIYAHNENLEPIFRKITNLYKHKNLEKFKEGKDTGKIKCSFANLLNLYKPIIIADEAHKNATSLAYETLNRLNPSFIVEYTATPAKNSNILHHVCAMELKAEEMIKLPIILTVHQTWQQSITAAIATRNGLMEAASKDKDYIRPIMLIQAESEGREATVEVIKKYLIEEENIDKNKIAIATGKEKGLEGINLLDKNCSIEYVITVEALKEGWDCPFAYVLCSAAQRYSTKDIEQLLGRVLRMPYAKTREQDVLNKAYAFVSSTSWQEGVRQLKDRLVHMGFKENEIPDSIHTQTKFPADTNNDENVSLLKLNLTSFNVDLFTNEELDKHIEITNTPIGQDICIKKLFDITPELEKKIIEATPLQERKDVKIAIELELKNQIANYKETPYRKGVVFEIPQLSLWADGKWTADYDEYFLDIKGDWLFEHEPILTEEEFKLKCDGDSISIDINGNHIIDKYILEKEAQKTLALDYDETNTNWDSSSLAIWITRQIPDVSIPQQAQATFIKQLVENLQNKRGISLNNLIRTKYILKDAIEDKIKKCKKESEEKGAQRILINAPSDKVKTDFEYSIDFSKKPYFPSREHMSTAFNKHYYHKVAHMNGEEVECARALDINDNVDFWVRNIEKYPYAFYLSKANGRFYPDFVAKLGDGRILVVEYKGEHLIGYDDTEDKKLIGELWEKTSNGKCLFLMGVKKNEFGSIYEQIDKKIKNQ